MTETYVPPRYLTVAETAKLVRTALKAAFPTVRFSVRSSSYAGGASIQVRYTDGPTIAEIERTARLYEGSTFDGMIDLKSSHTSVLVGPEGPEVVHFGADYVFVDRDLSPEYEAALAAIAQRCLNESGGIPEGTVFDRGAWYVGACRFGVFDTNGHALIRMLSAVVTPEGVEGDRW